MKIDMRKTVLQNLNSITAKMWEWNECPTFFRVPQISAEHEHKSGALLAEWHIYMTRTLKVTRSNLFWANMRKYSWHVRMKFEMYKWRLT